MSRRIVRIRKEIILPEKTISEKLSNKFRVNLTDNEIFRSNGLRDIYQKEDYNDDPIFLITQFFIQKEEKRREEIKVCLKRNINKFKKIFLLNERIYSNEELGVEKEDMVNIEQINIDKRLTYKYFFDFIKKLNIKGYYVLSNSDIFFDDTINNLRKTTLSEVKSFRALLRFEYNKEKDTMKCRINRNWEYSQDTWILHSNYFPESTEDLNFNLGLGGCDNSIAYLFYKKGYIIFNDPFVIRTYHYHTTGIRNWVNLNRTKKPYLYLKIDFDSKINNNNKENMIYNFKEIMIKLNLFWQYPVITEKSFSQINNLKNYIPFPWATVIDKKVNLENIFKVLEREVFTENNQTCCQHISFRKLISLFKRLKIKTLYTPHKIIGEDEIDGIKIKACPLYAVNFENNERNSLFLNKDFMNIKRKYLYSFRGGWNRCYMSDIRKKIFSIKNRSDILIQNSGEWHFEKAVYGGNQTSKGEYKKGSDINYYNQMILDSRYSLCPSGSGPNSIRFWECLACGSIPILLSDKLDLPEGEDWENSIVRIKESDINKIDEILENISKEKEEIMRKNCLEMYNKIGLKMEKEKNYDVIISYCCGSYNRGNTGGVARYDYQLSKIFKNRVFFQGPSQRGQMLRFLQRYKNPLIITDNHLSCDIPNKYNILLVHHGCARTTALHTPDWGEPWKSLCTNGQNKMLDYRDPETTTIISTSQSCTDDFTKYYGEKYTKFKRLDILHTSELDETRYKKNFNNKPVILGNWNHPKKGQKVLPYLKSKMKDFNFKQLSVGCNGKNFEDFNKRKQDIYLECDIFLQISNSEGFSYAALDAALCGLVIISTKVGFCYKDIPENCFIPLDLDKIKESDYIKNKILEGWEKREELSKNCRQWYLDNCRFIDWEKKMNKIVNVINNNSSKNMKRFGTQYGGFYYPENLENLDSDSIIYCVGAGEDISHDIEIARKLNSKVYIFDPTPRSIEHVNYIKKILNNEEKPKYNKRFGGGCPEYLDLILKNRIDTNNIHFFDYGLYTEDSELKFFKPSNKEYVSHSLVPGMKSNDFIKVQVKKLKTIMKELNHTEIDLLKIDIEGCECDVLEQMIEEKIYPKYLSVDFDLGWTGEKIKNRKKCLDTINMLKKYYKIIRSDGPDYSFVRKID